MHRKFKYPKLILFLITVGIAAVLLYEGKNHAGFHNFLVSLGYIGTFLGGFFYAYGFTSTPATAVLLVIAKEQHILLAVLVGGLGALLSDLFIFKFVRCVFMDEIEFLEREKIVKYIEKKEKTIFGKNYKYVFPAIACFLIASPLPTEMGVTMLACLKRMSAAKFAVIAYLLHSLGILVILLIGTAI